ncbi:RsbT co-antagonist protein RsbRA [Methanosarcinales archaeon]|nr:STAS domain-containing protein [Candidatus Methanoperedens sp.]CAG0955312.1 RsbT co-antagonist protein RsbRA [Methanosarcinales archaeon]
MKKKKTNEQANKSSAELRQELVDHFREKRELLRHQWVEQMISKGLLAGLTREEIETESMTIYDTCIVCLETGEYDGAQTYAIRMAERGVLRGMTSEQIIGGLLTLRDVYGRSLFERYQHDMERLSSALDIYEPVANKILSIVALAFVAEREKVVRQQQEAIQELSTPVLQVRDQMLILPIIGVIDTHRARQLTEQLLRTIRTSRAKVVVMDITGVPGVDSKVANHLVQTVDASQLMGATVIVTGISPEIAQTLVTLGVDLTKMNTVGDLQGGIEEADHLLGYKVVRIESSNGFIHKEKV